MLAGHDRSYQSQSLIKKYVEIATPREPGAEGDIWPIWEDEL